MLTRVLPFALGGAAAAALMLRLTHHMIRVRTGEAASGVLLSGNRALALWLGAGALGCAAIAALVEPLAQRIEYSAIFLVLLSLSVVDGLIKRIPNELLLALLGIKLAAVLYGGDFTSLLPALVAMVVGMGVFLIPSQMGINIGLGDVKLAAVAGFCLGLIGLMQSVLVMSLALGAYALYLLATRRGTLKSKVAMGPALSLGMLVTVMFPITLFI